MRRNGAVGAGACILLAFTTLTSAQQSVQVAVPTLPSVESDNKVWAYTVNNLSTEAQIRRPFPLPGSATTPAQAVEISALDLATISPPVQKYIRYLSGAHRKGGEQSVCRINIRDYGWTPELWERLAKRSPHWIFRGDVENEKGKKTGRKANVTLLHGSADAAFNALMNGTGSEAPIVFADWFLWQTAMQEFRGDAGYYDFLKIGKKEVELDRFLGFDAEVAKRFPAEHREVVIKSEITKYSRRLEWQAVRGGRYSFSSDVDDPTAAKNPLAFLDKGFKYTARESLFHLPNGLVGSALFDAEGNRQDKAPDTVVRHEVQVNIDCIRCHGPHAMWQPVNGATRRIYQKPRDIESLDYEKWKRLNRLYQSHLEPTLDDDRRRFVRALAEVNGWPPEKNSSEYVAVFESYKEVNLDRACRETGVTKESLVGLIQRYTDSLPETVETPLENFLLDRPEPIPVEMWHELYPKIMLLLKTEQKGQVRQ